MAKKKGNVSEVAGVKPRKKASKPLIGKSTVTTVMGAGSLLDAAIRQIYRAGADANAWVDGHIKELKQSDVPGIARTGRVLEAAKQGFALGYMTSVVVIAAGQFLLGNTGAALMSMASAAVLANPVAMTCAAVGAIFYGWAALSKAEQDELLGSLAEGLELGKELIKAIVVRVAELMGEFSEGSWSASIRGTLSVWGAGISSLVGDAGEAVVDIKSSILQKVDEARRRGFSLAR